MYAYVCMCVQVGADRMFSQMQHVFSAGMKTMSEANSRLDASQQAVNNEILAEVS